MRFNINYQAITPEVGNGGNENKVENSLQKIKDNLDNRIRNAQSKMQMMKDIIAKSDIKENDIVADQKRFEEALNTVQGLRQQLDTLPAAQYKGVLMSIAETFNSGLKTDRTLALKDELRPKVEELIQEKENLDQAITAFEQNITQQMSKVYGFEGKSFEEFSDSGLQTKLLDLLKDKGMIDKGVSDVYKMCLDKLPYNYNLKSGLDDKARLGQMKEIFQLGVKSMNREELKGNIRAVLGDMAGVKVSRGRNPDLSNLSSSESKDAGVIDKKGEDMITTAQNTELTKPTTETLPKIDNLKNFDSLSNKLNVAKDYNEFKSAVLGIGEETKQLRISADKNNIQPTRDAIKKYVDVLQSATLPKGSPAEASIFLRHEIAFAILQQDAAYVETKDNKEISREDLAKEKWNKSIDIKDKDDKMNIVYSLEQPYWNYFGLIGTAVKFRSNSPMTEANSKIYDEKVKAIKDIYASAVALKGKDWKTNGTNTVKDKDGKPVDFDMNQENDKYQLVTKYTEIMGNFKANFPGEADKLDQTAAKPGTNPENHGNEKPANTLTKSLETPEIKTYMDKLKTKFDDPEHKQHYLIKGVSSDLWKKEDMSNPQTYTQMVTKIFDEYHKDNIPLSVEEIKDTFTFSNKKGERLKDEEKNALKALTVYPPSAELIAKEGMIAIIKDGKIRGFMHPKLDFMINFPRVPGTKVLTMTNDTLDVKQPDGTYSKTHEIDVNTYTSWKKEPPTEYVNSIKTSLNLTKGGINVLFQGGGEGYRADNNYRRIVTYIAPEGGTKIEPVKTDMKTDIQTPKYKLEQKTA